MEIPERGAKWGNEVYLDPRVSQAVTVRMGRTVQTIR